MSQFFHAHHDTFFFSLAIIMTEQERRERAGEDMQ